MNRREHPHPGPLPEGEGAAANPKRLPLPKGEGRGEGLPRARALRRDATVPERLLWRAVRAGALGAKIRRQVPLGPYIVDFLAASARLVIELDGDTHASENARRYDAGRDAWLAAHGLRVLRFTNREVAQHLEGVLAAIAAAPITLTPTLSPGERDQEVRLLLPLPQGEGWGEAVAKPAPSPSGRGSG